MFLEVFLKQMPKSDYHDFPVEPSKDSGLIKVYDLSENEKKYIYEQSYNINEYCDCLIQIYDGEYLNYNKCIKLKEYLEKNPFPNELINLYNTFIDYCNIAIEKKTGLIIEL